MFNSKAIKIYYIITIHIQSYSMSSYWFLKPKFSQIDTLNKIEKGRKKQFENLPKRGKMLNTEEKKEEKKKKKKFPIFLKLNIHKSLNVESLSENFKGF